MLYTADYNDLCGQFFTQYSGEGTLCGHSFPLFAKDKGSTAEHVNFLGNVVVQCYSFIDLFVLNRMCLEPCMHEMKGCC